VPGLAFGAEYDLQNALVARHKLALGGLSKNDGLRVQIQVIGSTHARPTDFLTYNEEHSYIVGVDLSSGYKFIHCNNLRGDAGFVVD
jgi:hypothetical protein